MKVSKREGSEKANPVPSRGMVSGEVGGEEGEDEVISIKLGGVCTTVWCDFIQLLIIHCKYREKERK